MNLHIRISDMNGYLKISIAIMLCLMVPANLFSQEEEISIRESVQVVNVEVPVRVYYDGKPVDHLTREDFEIFADGKRQEIHGFFVKRKKIKLPAIKQAEKAFRKSRYFVLVFSVREINDRLVKGLHYILDEVLHANDRLMIMVSGHTHFFSNLENKEQAYTRIMELLEIQSREARDRLRRLVLDLRQVVPEGTEDDERAENYLKIYTRMLRKYRGKYLQPQLDTLSNFAAHLEKIPMEKWVLCFYQEEIYPHLGQDAKDWITNIIEQQTPHDGHQAHDARIIQRRLNRMERELSAARSFPTEVLHKLFVKSGATFHSLLIPTVNPPSFTYYDGERTWGFDFKRVSTDFENNLREITKKTGGALVHSGNLVSSLKAIEEIEDICYWLTFAPQDPGKQGKIRVSVRQPGYKTVYDNNMKSYYLRDFLARKEKSAKGLRLEDLSFANRRLSFKVTGFQVGAESGSEQARIKLRIRVMDDRNVSLFDQQKTLLPNRDNIQVSLPFHKLVKGKYFVLVDVMDLTTGQSDFSFMETAI